MAQNIDDFNRGVALILAHLYARFPIPAILKVAELDTHEDLLPEEAEGRDSRHAVYGAAVEFLADEGYLRYRGDTRGCAPGCTVFSHVVLTSKGLARIRHGFGVSSTLCWVYNQTWSLIYRSKPSCSAPRRSHS